MREIRKKVMNWSRNFCNVQKLVSFIWKTFLFFKKKIENETLLIYIKRWFFTLAVNDSVIHSIVTASNMKLPQNSFWQLKTRDSGIFTNSEVLLVEYMWKLKSHCFRVKPEENISVSMTYMTLHGLESLATIFLVLCFHLF